MLDYNIRLDSIRNLDIVEYLATLGYQPKEVRKNNTEYWYLSPFRDERKASFKVNRVKNVWFDFGCYKGGNMIDFGLMYFNCSLGELMEKFSAGPSLHERVVTDSEYSGDIKTGHVITVSERPLYTYRLQDYLHGRMIPLSVAKQHCCELSYQLNGHSFYGIGFKNDLGGYEVRNSLGKYCIGSKAITTVNNNAAEVNVFEGFMDFLSFKTTYQKEAGIKRDFVILNGAGLFDKAEAFLERHQLVRLWLDRDNTGLALTKRALALGEKYRDESGLYSKYEDLNDWLCHKTASRRKSLKHKIK
ncbi:MAG: toprim domain-containing protein [Sphingobacteriales bacterium]